MTNSIAEIKDAQCIFVIGANTTSAHPVIGYEIIGAAKKGAKLIVANPKEIALCEHADLFLRHRPGTDVALLMGMCRVIVEKKLHDRDYIGERCENFEEFVKALGAFSLGETERITGVEASLIETAAEMYASHKPGMLFYAMGITQHTHGTDNVLATSNLALLTGNIGVRSSGVNPLRGQNNVQGACDMGALPNVYPGYQRVNLPEIRQKFEKAWGVPLSETAGLTHLEIFDAVMEGKVKALFQMGENPVLSEANASHVYEALAKLEFFVAQDLFLTESARFAHVVLPAASFAEKDGTFTNTERRVQRVRKAVEPVGQSKPDWQIVCELARAMGHKGFDFKSPDRIMEEIAHLTPSYGGITYEKIERQGIPWPCPSADSEGTPVLHTRFFATQSGRGKFVPLVFKPPFELPDEEYPLLLTTDRSLYHFHTATMTRKGGLSVLRREELVEIHPEDARALGIVDGETVKVVSRRGEVKSRVKVTEASPEGVVCMTFHFAESPTNLLTSSAVDPVAKIPETKVCAVRVERQIC
jgi:formate dehydrogenase alpha subunit